MTFAEILAQVIGVLDGAGVPYMVTGSLASSYHGEPRATRDVDIVIDPTPVSLREVTDALAAAGFYIDADAASAALASRSQFNAIGSDASKVDFIIRRDRPFSVEELRRREPADLLGTPGFVATAEDVVLAKLEWAAESDSNRQLRDAAAIVAITRDLDVAYLDRWAARLGVTEAWQSIRDQAET